MAKYLYEGTECKSAEEVVKTYGVKDDAVVRIITPDSEMKWGFLKNEEVSEWVTRWVHLRCSPRMAELIKNELKIFKEAHPKAEVIALAQDFVVHLFCKGLNDDEMSELERNLQKYNW